MVWDGIPWFVEGTQASEETVRLLAEVAASGGEGIVGPADLQVRALAMPGPAVTVGAGAMVARRRASGPGRQSYAARNPTLDQVEIAPTGVDGPRSDLVIARIEDPYGGEVWPAPADPAIGPYVWTRVISSVPPGTRSIADIDPGSTAITLARVDLPAKTSAVTAAMITDLRQMAQPRIRTERAYLHSAWPTPDDLGLLPDVWEEFPLGARWEIGVPDWATHVNVHASMTGLLHPNSAEARGLIRVTHGAQLGTGLPFRINSPARVTLLSGHNFVVPPAERGTRAAVSVQATTAAGTTGLLQADTGTALSLEVTYSQAPVGA
ncbi:hypothetical protein ACIP93_33365 [Streptomyces sp. NPDC088745]|uniref:hypothetical protein n=1 Tax=Streptomyces sp. NPDC088745 TaxID=3365884 RepID=UPI0038104A19